MEYSLCSVSWLASVPRVDCIRTHFVTIKKDVTSRRGDSRVSLLTLHSTACWSFLNSLSTSIRDERDVYCRSLTRTLVDGDDSLPRSHIDLRDRRADIECVEQEFVVDPAYSPYSTFLSVVFEMMIPFLTDTTTIQEKSKKGFHNCVPQEDALVLVHWWRYGWDVIVAEVERIYDVEMMIILRVYHGVNNDKR